MDMGLAAVAGIAHSSDHISRCYGIARSRANGSGLEVRDEQELARRHFQHHVVAKRTKETALANRPVLLAILNVQHNSIGRCQHLAPVCVKLVETRAIALVRHPVHRDEQVIGPALIRHHGVVVLLERRPSPCNGDWAIERNSEQNAAWPCVVR